MATIAYEYSPKREVSEEERKYEYTGKEIEFTILYQHDLSEDEYRDRKHNFEEIPFDGIDYKESKIRLREIRACRDISLVDGTVVHKGDLGGWIEEDYNLSHKGNSWVKDKAMVFEYGRIVGDALAKDHAIVWGGRMLMGKEIAGQDMELHGAHIYTSFKDMDVDVQLRDNSGKQINKVSLKPKKLIQQLSNEKDGNSL